MAGYDLCLVDRDQEGLTKAAGSNEAAGGTVMYHAADVLRRPDVEDFTDAALKKYGRIDALANIAGGAGPKSVHQIDEISDDDWNLVINLRSTYWACQAVIAAMREQSHSRIVNMSSTSAHGRIGPVGTTGARLVYATAKAGILGFTHQLAKDVAEFGIIPNAVLPRLILSEPGSRIRARFEAQEPAYREDAWSLAHASGRRGGRSRRRHGISVLGTGQLHLGCGTAHRRRLSRWLSARDVWGRSATPSQGMQVAGKEAGHLGVIKQSLQCR
ncbi:MAG: hypothetical protein CMM23_14565 [Rhodospirillaceae bacterium]|jgi:NAD(P)-dependent dehydrogenase (short-subunit alcohol dehydrogenase family)|nr:hypothetical protein [Rhodospirillaceae bacterium]